MKGISSLPFCQMQKKSRQKNVYSASGGKGGIRTPGTVARSPHFECGPFDHSGTFPVKTM